MQFELLTLIPALAAIIWAITVKIKLKQTFDVVTLMIVALAVIANALVVFYIISERSCPVYIHYIQILSSSMIVPLAYSYFSRQMGRKWNNTTAVFCWTLLIFTLFPNINIFIGGNRTIADSALVRNFSFNIIHNGGIIFTCHTADLIILIQALLTVARMIPAAMTLKKYGLATSRKMKSFYLWWMAAVCFIVYTSLTSTEYLISPSGSWTYFISYSFLVCSIFTMLALRLDLNPVVTKEEGESVNVDDFIDANKAMAKELNKLMEQDKIYLNPGYTAEDAATALGTNRTYFSRMMMAEFGMKFTDIINNYRIEMVKSLLLTTSKSIMDIALESGFSDASYMSRKFHQKVGVTPHEYRSAR